MAKPKSHTEAGATAPAAAPTDSHGAFGDNLADVDAAAHAAPAASDPAAVVRTLSAAELLALLDEPQRVALRAALEPPAAPAAPAPETPTVRLQAPEHLTSLSIAGVEYPVVDGYVHVAVAAVPTAQEFGCELRS